LASASSTRDVKDAYEDEIEKWCADMLMLVSNKGFDIDAIGMANKYYIYCVKAGRTYEFVGKMDREDFENNEESEYYSLAHASSKTLTVKKKTVFYITRKKTPQS